MTQGNIQPIEPAVAAVHAAIERASEAARAEIKAMTAQAIASINRRAGQHRRRLYERIGA